MQNHFQWNRWIAQFMFSPKAKILWIFIRSLTSEYWVCLTLKAIASYDFGGGYVLLLRWTIREWYEFRLSAAVYIQKFRVINPICIERGRRRGCDREQPWLSLPFVSDLTVFCMRCIFAAVKVSLTMFKLRELAQLTVSYMNMCNATYDLCSRYAVW